MRKVDLYTSDSRLLGYIMVDDDMSTRQGPRLVTLEVGDVVILQRLAMREPCSLAAGRVLHRVYESLLKAAGGEDALMADAHADTAERFARLGMRHPLDPPMTRVPPPEEGEF